MNSVIKINEAIAIIGLGYVGLPLAVEFGKIRPVIGFDINVKRIAQLQSGYDSTLETEPKELQSAKHLKFSTLAEDLRAACIYIVCQSAP